LETVQSKLLVLKSVEGMRELDFVLRQEIRLTDL
jgi:hypothetical protein